MKYPVGIQTFEKIIAGGFVYVDKTDLIYSLVKEGQIYFLSRPRRFGKSLLLSTLRAYFEGKKELFAGLKIDALEHDWHVHLQQIDDKGYARPYEAEARAVCKVGVSFALEMESSMQESPTVSQPTSGSWIFTSMRRLQQSTRPKRRVRESE